MRELYNRISEKLNQIEFSHLWLGFQRYEFAIYTSNTVWLEGGEIPWDDRFMGNTAIQYEGRFIAIWSVENFTQNEDIDLMASNMVHEMFHAFQKEMGEIRYPQDLLTLDYPDELTNYCLKVEENKILAQASDELNFINKRHLLSVFCGIRKKRKELIGDRVQCEYLTETAEGMAEYIGTNALKELSLVKFQKRIEEYTGYLRSLENQFNIRRISYYSGAIFLLTAQAAEFNFEHNIAGQKKTVYEIVSEKIIPEAIGEIVLDPNIESAVQQYKESKAKEIAAFFEKDRTGIEGRFHICGYDPMNMIKINNQILCKHFIMLKEDKSNQDLMLMGETLLDMVPHTINQVQCYYR